MIRINLPLELPTERFFPDGSVRVLDAGFEIAEQGTTAGTLYLLAQKHGDVTVTSIDG